MLFERMDRSLGVRGRLDPPLLELLPDRLALGAEPEDKGAGAPDEVEAAVGEMPASEEEENMLTILEQAANPNCKKEEEEPSPEDAEPTGKALMELLES